MNLPSKTTIISYVRARKFVVLVSALLVVTIAWALIYQYGLRGSSNNPDFQAVLPYGKTISRLGGWQRVSPPENDPVFAFADKVDGIPVIVSQQPLPEAFKGNVNNQVADLAKKFNATTELEAGDTTVYVGTSSKGPQSVITAKNGLLILIKSEKVVKDVAWTDYVRSLSDPRSNNLPKY